MRWRSSLQERLRRQDEVRPLAQGWDFHEEFRILVDHSPEGDKAFVGLGLDYILGMRANFLEEDGFAVVDSHPAKAARIAAGLDSCKTL